MTRHPLSEFMPYGAPDLLSDADRRVAAATVTSTALVVLLFAGLFAAAAMFASRVIPAVAPRDRVIDILDFTLPPPPPVYIPEQAQPAPPEPDHATPVPVPESMAPPADVHDMPQGNTPGAVPGDAPARVENSTGIQPRVEVDRLPDINEPTFVDEMPELIRGDDPVYPDIARMAAVEGTVRIRMLVGKNGRVLEARVEPRGSVPMLDDAAIAAAMTCVFKPAFASGHPVPVWVSRPYRFRLN